MADGDELDEWDSYVNRSEAAGPFHQREGIELLADHTGTTLHPLVAYKGQQAIGILPVFEQEKGPFTMVLSPPSHTEVYYLGAALLDTHQLKQRKKERRNRRFAYTCHEWIEENLSPDLTHIRTVDRYQDLRPFKEKGYAVEPYYTYVTDLTPSEDDLLMELSSDARSNVRNTDEAAYDIEVGGLAEAKEIIERVRERHDDQELDYHIDDQYITRLYTKFPEGQVKPYSCWDSEGEFIGGIVAIEHEDTIYRWQGGTKGDAEIPVNDLLDWHVMTDAKSRGIERYDFVGANQRRICRYKSKFAPDLATYHGALKRSRRAETITTARDTVTSLLPSR
ncbi:MAG: GNAT family N-acetyltransferase [Halalkalicoccus sp.]